MIKQKHNIWVIWIALLTVVLTACRTEVDTPPDMRHAPLSFLIDDEATAMHMPQHRMPAAAQAEVELPAQLAFNQFIVYAYKNFETATTYNPVMEGFRINYIENTAHTTESNTHDWEYVGTGANYTSLRDDPQTIRYWDGNAFAYRFAAVAGTDHTGSSITANPISYASAIDVTHTFTDGTADVKCHDITIHMQGGKIDTGNPDTTIYYSHLEVVQPTAYTQPVKMRFFRPLAKVRIGFIFGELVTPYVLPLTDISFRPQNTESQIAAAADITISYPLLGTQTADLVEHLLVSNQSGNQPFTFANVTETAIDECDPAHVPTDGYQHRFINPTQYYTIPQAGEDYVLHVTYAGSEHTVVVPANKMQWNPNQQYTYIFRILDPQHIIMVDAIVTDWTYGGYLEDEQHHW